MMSEQRTMTQLESLVATMEQVANGRDAVEAAAEYLRTLEGSKTRSVEPQVKRAQALRLWRAGGLTTQQIAERVGLTDKQVKRIVMQKGAA